MCEGGAESPTPLCYEEGKQVVSIIATDASQCRVRGNRDSLTQPSSSHKEELLLSMSGVNIRSGEQTE